jgi:VanZ family protein
LITDDRINLNPDNRTGIGPPTKESCYLPPMSILLKLIAWLLAAAVTFATLGPPSYRPHSPFGQAGEHALAFVLVGLAFGLAYRKNRRLTAAIAVIMIGVLELLQFVVPGRHARLEDYLVDAMSACAGLALATAVEWLTSRRWRSAKAI